MAIHRLKPRFVDTVTGAGMYADGGGLYLQVGAGGSAKSWIFRYSRSPFGKPGEAHMGLGPTHTISLDEARELARECRQQILGGVDPLADRKAKQRAKKLEASKHVTFEFCAQDYLEHKRRVWTSPDTFRNAATAIRMHLNPALGKLPVSAIDHLEIERMLRPIIDKSKTRGEYIRQQLKAILDRATAREFRVGDNPANLEGPLGILFHEAERRHFSKPRAALPYHEIGSFMARLRAWRTSEGKLYVPALALEFIILTAVRVSQATSMRWEEIDLVKGLWTCPWQRTKTGKKTRHDHLVVLSPAALSVLMEMRKMEVKSEFVFANQKARWGGRKPHHAGSPIERHAPSMCLNQSLGRRDITVHGFRTTFSSWANDYNFPREAIEIALDHTVGNQVERTYARDAKRLEQRRKLMEAWAEYCARTEPLPAEVVPFRQAN